MTGGIVLLLSAILTLRAEGAQDIPHVSKGMLMPEYWINRAATPDRVFMSKWDMMRINSLVYQDGNQVRPHDESAWVEGRRIRGYIEEDHLELRQWRKYDDEDRKLADSRLDREMRKLTRPDRVPDRVRVMYGLTVRRTQVRMMPTAVRFQRRPGDPDFDILVKTMAEPGTPVTVYHFSRDRKWAFVLTPECTGWIRAVDLAWSGDRGIFRPYEEAERFLVVTGKEALVYRDRRYMDATTGVSMGGWLPLVREEKGRFVVLMPDREEGGKPQFYHGYVPARGDVREGSPSLTVRNLLLQSFKWLGAEYRWGHLGSTTDCSGFVLSVLRTFGMEVPRSSELELRAFGLISMPASAERKRNRLVELLPFRTLLGFSGHIGLYLGMVGDRHYMIHATNGYWTSRNGFEHEVIIRRVVVSDLSLGEGGRNGSLMDRLSYAAIID